MRQQRTVELEGHRDTERSGFEGACSQEGTVLGGEEKEERARWEEKGSSAQPKKGRENKTKEGRVEGDDSAVTTPDMRPEEQCPTLLHSLRGRLTTIAKSSVSPPGCPVTLTLHRFIPAYSSLLYMS